MLEAFYMIITTKGKGVGRSAKVKKTNTDQRQTVTTNCSKDSVLITARL